MSSIKVLGIDLGKSSFHLIGRDSHEQNILRKKLTRSDLLEYIAQLPPCIVAFEACGCSHWLARKCLELEKGEGPFHEWLRKLRLKKPFNIVCIALANKLARIAWAVLRNN